MSNDFNASLVISTSEAVTNVRNVDAAAKDLDKTLAHLHTTMQSTQGDLDKVAGSLKTFTATQRQANRDQKDRNATLISEAKLEREQIVNKGKVAEQTNKQAMAEAKLQGVRARNGRNSAAGLGNETRRNQESAARITGTNAQTTARLTTEAERLEGQTHRTAAALAARSAAEDRAQMTAMRLAAAQQRATNSSLALNDSLSNSRYLLYDVGATYATLSAVLLAIPAATTAVAASYEKDFTNVIRTTGVASTEAKGLYEEIKQLGREIPLSFAEFGNIASIAGQLGIAKAEIGAFTETVAKFAAASNVSIDEAATAFGRFKNSFNADGNIEDFYNRVGSAIALVGINSAASETEIIAVSNQISAAGAQFGFTADQIVGMSGALASVRIRPELARGAFQRILLGLSRAADEGAEAFQHFGKYTELAADESLRLFKTDPSAFFQKYIAGLKGTIDKGNSVSAVMDDIGAKNVFDKQFLLGLVNNVDLYNKAMSDSAGAFEDGSFLTENTKASFETFLATMTKLASAFQNLGASLGGGTLGPLTDMAQVIANVVNGMDRLIEQSPHIAVVINGLLAIGGVVGAFLAFKAAQAFVLAGLVGLQQVMGKASIQGALSLKGNMAELAKTMLMSKGASAEAAQSYIAASGAMKALGNASVATRAQVAGLNTTMAATGTAAMPAAAAATGRFGGRLGALGSGISGLVGGPLGALVGGLAAVGIAFMSAEEKANQAGDAIARAMKNGGDAGTRAIGDALTDRTVDSWITDVGAGGVGNHGKNVRKIAEEIGISFDDIVASVSKGTDAGKEFQKVMDAFAVGKGFKDFNDLAANSTNLQNYRGELQFIEKVVGELGTKFASSKDDIKSTDDAVTALGGAAGAASPGLDELSGSMEDVADKAQEARDAITEAVDAIFGIVNAEAAAQESLGKLGAGLVETTSFNIGHEGGRNNMANFQDTLRNAALQQQNLIETGQQTMQQAASNYTAFIDSLMQQLASKGVDVSEVQKYANQAKTVFGATLATGPQPTVMVKSEPTQVVTTAGDVRNAIQSVLDAQPAEATIWADASQADAQMQSLAKGLAEISGIPYTVVLDALTNPANEKSKQVYDLLTSITNGTYVAPVNADTSAAITNVQNFLAYARTELAHLQSELNGKVGYGDGEGSLGTAQKAQYDALGAPQMVSAPAAAAAPVINTPAIQAPPIMQPDFAGLENGYRDAAKEAEKAGEKGKKAGEDMANGIDDATNAANDYANRLRQGLQSAFDKQYAMATAADAYHSALNAINKKREDELQQIQDLIAKQKELNNSRKEDLVTARKAGIEKAISQKYGETDRAMDYANQEQTALDNAAAKQKDIEATRKQANEIQAGIGKLTGYSQAAIDNRAALRDLESKMLDMVSAYASTGKSVDQVRAYAAKLTGQFRADVVQIGYNRTAVTNLQGNLSRYIGVVKSVPAVKPTKVTADTSQATRAINGVKSALNGIPNNTNKTVTTTYVSKVFSGIRKVQGEFVGNEQVYDVVYQDGTKGPFQIYNRGGEVQGFNNGGLIPGTPPTNPRKDNLFANVDGKGQVMVRSGEFIVQQPAVDYWGLDFFKRLNDMKMPAFNAGGSVGGGRSSAVSSGPVLVELTAENIAAIQRLPQVNLFTENRLIAQSANDGNAILATQGAN